MLRRLLAGVVLAVMLASVATSGWLVAGGPLVAEASGAATVTDETLAAHGYSPMRVEHVRVDEAVRAGGVTKRVNVSMYVAATTTTDPDRGPAGLMTATLPAARVAGVATNPLAHVPVERAFEFVVPHLPTDMESFEAVGSRSVSVAGETRTVTTYEARAASGEVLELSVARVVVGEDLVVVVGTQPAGAGEGATLLDLMAALEHSERPGTE
ncbi:DUF6517 family protein [Halomarina litorea]|uniref:DUF6517 family protein n=1 Tax=Halomarina litorea TaxID=2961595 RepID=UPI0020C2DF49|nr:DUF6517 family protein [Halomarina sp. BCD28]